MNLKTEDILCTNFGPGRRHDFHLFKQSDLGIHPDITTLTDTGYLGIHHYHARNEQPKKRSKKNPLTKEDKKENRRISSERVFIENVFSRIKRFHIVADRYRNRRKRFGLRFNLLAAIHNKEFAKKQGAL